MPGYSDFDLVFVVILFGCLLPWVIFGGVLDDLFWFGCCGFWFCFGLVVWFDCFDFDCLRLCWMFVVCGLYFVALLVGVVCVFGGCLLCSFVYSVMCGCFFFWFAMG